ncbi:GNAT family N-acetyltransferase [Leisingera sp. McT4-56]|uniref:GNAT family N-acetyltransferase n=1 Tax=Leisingera sp. McT4-56 TaxID=2881255 RepID=UPI001CF8BC97|nr:GNAT family N-acetyltransferase [Leisingera sp. McT4-56]MCB4457541.1 GNAT family N-acetyltransferase [Leisingera sp. McT4-56]
MGFCIDELNGSDNLTGIGELFRRYADWLEKDHGIAPEIHGIDAEIGRLPIPYCSPDGTLLGARAPDGAYVGCIALRRLDDQSCEVKRLFVLPEMRGHRIGEALIATLIEKARSLGYARIVLDVGDYQKPARALYAKSGFKEVPPMSHISYPGAVFMAYDL